MLKTSKPNPNLGQKLDQIIKWSENEYEDFRQANPEADPVRSNFSDTLWRLNNAARHLKRLCVSPDLIKTYDRLGKELPTNLGEYLD